MREDVCRINLTQNFQDIYIYYITYLRRRKGDLKILSNEVQDTSINILGEEIYTGVQMESEIVGQPFGSVVGKQYTPTTMLLVGTLSPESICS